MKRSLCLFISLLTVLSLVLSGCADKDAPDGYQNAAGESEAFYLYVPTTWVLNNSGGTASAYYSSDDFSNVSMTCMVIDPGEMDELEEYKTFTLAELEAVLPDFKVIESAVDSDIPEEDRKPLTLGGRDGEGRGEQGHDRCKSQKKGEKLFHGCSSLMWETALPYERAEKNQLSCWMVMEPIRYSTVVTP